MFNFSKIKRIVIKVGSSSLAQETSLALNTDFIKILTKRIVDLKKDGKEVVLVTSGAILAGMEIAKLSSRPASIIEKQRLSSLGQALLMTKYARSFSRYKTRAGQILLTASDTESPTGKKHLVDLINCLLKAGDIPIINENDAVTTDEIKIGDNDTLAAYVATMIDADLLILLSDIDGLYNRNPTDPNAKLIKRVDCINEEIKKMAGADNKRNLGTGGMLTKLKAAEICLNAGITMILMNAKNKQQWQDLVTGKNQGGTLFKKRVN